MNEFAPRYINEAREGFFKVRLKARSKIWIPVRFFRELPLDPDTGEILDRWPRLAAERDEAIIDDHTQLLDLWPWCRELTFGEWQWLKQVEWPIRKRSLRMSRR